MLTIASALHVVVTDCDFGYVSCYKYIFSYFTQWSCVNSRKILPVDVNYTLGLMTAYS